MKSLPCFLVAALIAAAVHPAAAQIDARMLRQPDVSATQITFVYAGDIWVAPKNGGVAQRLSSPAGEESFPRFSPDGSRIAFSGNYDGNTDVYVIPTSGGQPTRITHHPMGDRLVDWLPDGESLLYASSMESGKQRFNQFYKVSPDGGHPEKLPLPFAEFGAVSTDGRQLAYIPITRDFRTWKRYRGGMAPDIWLFDLQTFESRNLTDHDANDTHPMWHGSTLYFLSDRDDNKRYNIWAYDLDGDAVRQVTHFTDFDVHFPAIGPSDIVFEAGGGLHLMNLGTEAVREVKIEVLTDRTTLRAREQNVENLIQNAWISPTGKRAVFEARGDIFSVPAEHGVVVNLTRSSGVAERYPAWSPDGKQIAYFSDRSGEYELTVRAADGSGEETALTRLGEGFRYQPYWSPDGKKLAFVDQAMTINVFDVDSRRTTAVDRGLWLFHGGLQGFFFSWSPDSRWLAFSREMENRQGAIFLYDSRNGRLHQATSGFYSDFRPAFDPDGKYLFLLTNRHFEPAYGDMDNSWVYPNTTQVAAIPLRKDVPSPLAPRNDEESDETVSDETKEKPDDKDEKPEAKVADVEIDLDGFERRLVVLPPKPGNYNDLQAVSGKVVYRQFPRTGSGDEKARIAYYDLEAREEKTVLEDAGRYRISADGKKLLTSQNGKYAILDVAPDQKFEKPLRTAELEAPVNPVAEWRQIFNDAWRLQRDYFYDPGMHGVDWKEIRRRYGALLEDAVTRWDVNFVIGEMIAELSASHTYRGGGDAEQPKSRGVGLLGVDWSVENGAYRIARIIDGAPWDNEVRSPLREPGVVVSEGDYVLAVNGVPLDPAKDPWAPFEGLADKTVRLTVNSRPTADGAREILVKTLSDETRLRNLAWIDANRRRVEEATGGRVGYVYVPDTGVNGQTELVRQFVPQFTKEGLIIDERFNSGGQIPDRFVELLNRPLYNYWGVRDGMDWQWPPVAHNGPQVMLVNGWSGSGGDAFPAYFKAAGRGPLIGTRTWGGLIGISGAPGLIDGGGVTVPTFGIYSNEGEWIIEGYGVDPDVEVVEDPTQMARGVDPQLERAIEEVLRMLEERPVAVPRRPVYPTR